MSRTARAVAAVLLSVACLSATPLHGQSTDPGAFRVGAPVEVEYVPGSGKWLTATVVEVLDDGYSYKVDIAPRQGAAESRTSIHFRRVRVVTPPTRASAAPAAGAGFATATTAGTAATAGTRPAVARPAAGRYACTESRYNSSTSMYEYDARGAFTISADGRYSYLGFARPSAGRYSVDGGSGRVKFTGGHLGGGEATPIDGRPGRYYLTAPATGSRWTCGLADGR